MRRWAAGRRIGAHDLELAAFAAQRRRIRGCQAGVLEQLVRHARDDEALVRLEQWLQLAPFDRRPHEAMLQRLGSQGRIREAEEHLATTTRLFQSEGINAAPLHAAWRSIHAGRPAPQAVRIEVIEPARIGAEEAGRILDVDYVVGGWVRSKGGRLTVGVEVAETRSGRIIWGTFARKSDTLILLLVGIGTWVDGRIAHMMNQDPSARGRLSRVQGRRGNPSYLRCRISIRR